MKRFYVHDLQENEDRCTIRGSEARHISRVMRMGPGDRLVLMDGKGRRFQAVVEASDPREVVVSVERALPAPGPSPLSVHLCQALLKSQAMDDVIRKASELGVDVIHPFSSARTVVRLQGERAAGRLRRWREIAVHAATQSDRAAPARIEPPAAFADLMGRWKPEGCFKVLFWEGEDAVDVKSVLSSRHRVDRIAAVIGPEGGFTGEEVRSAVDAGFRPASLGRRVLRAETAAVAVLAVLQYEWGDLFLDETPTGSSAGAAP